MINTIYDVFLFAVFEHYKFQSSLSESCFSASRAVLVRTSVGVSTYSRGVFRVTGGETEPIRGTHFVPRADCPQFAVPIRQWCQVVQNFAHRPLGGVVSVEARYQKLVEKSRSHIMMGFDEDGLKYA